MLPSDPSRQLHDLDRTSPRFHKQLLDILHADEYQNIIPNLENEDVVWLVRYLDKVSHQIVFPLPQTSASLIARIINRKEPEVVKGISRNNAQSFIDVIDKVLYHPFVPCK